MLFTHAIRSNIEPTDVLAQNFGTLRVGIASFFYIVGFTDSAQRPTMGEDFPGKPLMLDWALVVAGTMHSEVQMYTSCSLCARYGRKYIEDTPRRHKAFVCFGTKTYRKYGKNGNQTIFSIWKDIAIEIIDNFFALKSADHLGLLS